MSGTRLFAAQSFFGVDSPNRYSSMLTKTKRFADPHRDGVDFYECEFGTKKSIDRNVQGRLSLSVRKWPPCVSAAWIGLRWGSRMELARG